MAKCRCVGQRRRGPRTEGEVLTPRIGATDYCAPITCRVFVPLHCTSMGTRTVFNNHAGNHKSASIPLNIYVLDIVLCTLWFSPLISVFFLPGGVCIIISILWLGKLRYGGSSHSRSPGSSGVTCSRRGLDSDPFSPKAPRVSTPLLH